MMPSIGKWPAVLFLLVLMLSACSIGPTEKRAPHIYLLDAEISEKQLAVGFAPEHLGALLVSAPRARAGFDTARMAYLLRPHELSYYAFNQWADTPGRMLSRLLALAMEKTDLWRVVIQAPSPVRADYRLDSDSLALEQQFFSTPSRVRLAVRMQLIDLKRQEVLSNRYFEVFEEAPADDAYGGVIAANRAAAKLLEAAAVWVSSVITERAHTGG